MAKCCGPHGGDDTCNRGCLWFSESDDDKTICICGHEKFRHLPPNGNLCFFLLLYVVPLPPPPPPLIVA